MTPAPETRRCANCGEIAGPHFCAHCGQEVAARQGPLGSVVREMLGDVWELDSRLVRSLRALAKPGELSRLYLKGRRAPFLRPFRLYILTSLVLFSTVLTLATPDPSQLEIYIGDELVTPADGSDQEPGELVPEEKRVRKSLQFLKGGGFMTRLAGDRVARLRGLPREEIVEKIFSGFRRTLPTALVLFVPFLALGLKLLYIRKRAAHSLYLDHLVFALHFQSALFLALALDWVVIKLFTPPFVAAVLVYALTAFVILVVYLPWALRRFYRQSRIWTAVKTVAVLFVYVRLLDLAVGASTLIAIWDV